MTTLSITTQDGRSYDGYSVASGTATAPAVLILPEMFGMNDAMRRVVDDYARRGFSALLPNVFWRSEHPRGLAYDGADRELAWARLKALDLDDTVQDIGLAARFLRERSPCNGKVVTIGFCGGGRLAVLAAMRHQVDAAVSLYGLGIPQHFEEMRNIRCPTQLHYGDADQHIPKSEIDAVAKAAVPHPTIEVFIYPNAGHSFFNPVRPNYNAATASLAASRIDRLLDSMGSPQ
ncbi:MAG: dienelactone hydrolase family protein [Rhizobiales bacterium]|nr:dienelactone hydrolase family protein [Hyphomicrobiales bacterium]